MLKPKDLDSVAALMAAERTTMGKEQGEKDTEFVKRIVCAYVNATPYADAFREVIARAIVGERNN